MSALRDFVSDLLEAEGAVVDPVDADGLDVLAPEPVRKAFGWSQELVRLGFGATRPSHAVPIGLEGDWLDRFGNLLGERGRLAQRQVSGQPSSAPNAPERLLERALELPNAVWRLTGIRQTWTRCLLLAFRYAATSDEKRDGIVWLGFNVGTGAVLTGPLLSRIGGVVADGSTWRAPQPEVIAAAGAAGIDMAALAARVPPLLEHRMREDLEPFLGSMRRRLDRDRGRVHAYHNELRQTALGKLAKLRGAAGDKAAAGRQRETLRAAAIEREYAAKIDDLRHKYALQVKAQWMQGLIVFAPVQRFEILIKRRKGERAVTMDWHEGPRLLEPPVDEGGLGLDAARLVCDDHLHMTGRSSHVCPSCGKERCRACHPTACPRCRSTSARPLQ